MYEHRGRIVPSFEHVREATHHSAPPRLPRVRERLISLAVGSATFSVTVTGDTRGKTSGLRKGPTLDVSAGGTRTYSNEAAASRAAGLGRRTVDRGLTGYTYFDHDADMGIVGHGLTPEAAMESAAEATFALMADLDQIKAKRSVEVDFDEPDPELALVVWLNRLLAEARAEGLALGEFRLEQLGSHWHGTGSGEPWRPDLQRGVEVKGATLTMLAVRPTRDGWEARCVVDV